MIGNLPTFDVEDADQLICNYNNIIIWKHTENKQRTYFTLIHTDRLNSQRKPISFQQFLRFTNEINILQSFLQRDLQRNSKQKTCF